MLGSGRRKRPIAAAEENVQSVDHSSSSSDQAPTRATENVVRPQAPTRPSLVDSDSDEDSKAPAVAARASAEEALEAGTSKTPELVRLARLARFEQAGEPQANLQAVEVQMAALEASRIEAEGDLVIQPENGHKPPLAALSHQVVNASLAEEKGEPVVMDNGFAAAQAELVSEKPCAVPFLSALLTDSARYERVAATYVSQSKPSSGAVVYSPELVALPRPRSFLQRIRIGQEKLPPQMRPSFTTVKAPQMRPSFTT